MSRRFARGSSPLVAGGGGSGARGALAALRRVRHREAAPGAACGCGHPRAARRHGCALGAPADCGVDGLAGLAAARRVAGGRAGRTRLARPVRRPAPRPRGRRGTRSCLCPCGPGGRFRRSSSRGPLRPLGREPPRCCWLRSDCAATPEPGSHSTTNSIDFRRRKSSRRSRRSGTTTRSSISAGARAAIRGSPAPCSTPCAISGTHGRRTVASNLESTTGSSTPADD